MLASDLQPLNDARQRKKVRDHRKQEVPPLKTAEISKRSAIRPDPPTRRAIKTIRVSIYATVQHVAAKEPVHGPTDPRDPEQNIGRS